ncbi:VOC family protein [Altererythrobacter sp. MF3-039]|uniref:VOC family protein n=1 Tax=Altererythrobacter sp. MF3-039 TaxID=3252901 RepID=UPI00390C650D
MRTVALAALAPLALAGCAASIETPAAAPVAESGASEGTVLRRATLLTHDIEKSIRFYEIIGFEQWYVGQPGKISESGLPVEGTKAGDPSRFVIMKGKHPYIGMIGLLQYGEARKAGAPAMRHGDAIMMVEAEGLDEIFRQLVANGYAVHKEIETVPIQSVTDSWDARFAMVYDPDGHLVELTERLN